jgi:predicted NAD/FAD-binding protein
LGGSRVYVEKLTRPVRERARLGCAAVRIERGADGVVVRDVTGHSERYDEVVVACHADQGLALLDAPTPAERAILGAFTYTRNRAVLHSDPSLMPRRRKAWSSWNYLGRAATQGRRDLCVTYWMNLLQSLPREHALFVTLNPFHEPDSKRVIRVEEYDHPLFDAAALQAQKQLWSVQGKGGLWWCGSYFGAGFHEDGLQAGLAVAEALGGVRRPWSVERESARIFLGPAGHAPRWLAAA